MRAPFLILLAATLGLAGCGNDDQSANTANVDETLTAQNIVSNDVTAIDAVTADAANMAADVDFTNELENLLNNEGNATEAKAPAKPGARPARTPAPAPAPAETATKNAD